MPQKLLKFKDLNQSLLNSAQVTLSQWLPGGVLRGSEFVCGSIGGEAGSSLSINTRTGVWKDFSTGQGGADLISLYAEIKGLKQGEAYKELAGSTKIKSGGTRTKEQPITPIPPPTNEVPNTTHRQHGKASSIYRYCNSDSQLLYLICRYDLDDGSKDIRPFIYTKEKGWISKQWPAPRPMFGLEILTDKVLLVEGEKACLAARKYVSKRSVLTWPGGSSAIKQTDWSPLAKKDILIWPDHDDAGRTAAARITEKLLSLGCKVSIIDTSNEDLPEGYDAADFTGTKAELVGWMVPLIKTIEAPKPEPEPKTKAPAVSKPAAHPELVTPDKVKTLALPAVEYGKSQQATLPVLASLVSTLFGRELWYSSFYLQHMTSIPPHNSPTDKAPWPIENEQRTRIRFHLENNFDFKRFQVATLKEAIQLVASNNIRNEPLEWIKSTEWDGVERLHTWLHDYAGVDDNEYTRAVSKNFIQAMCKRIEQPGCKFDHVLVLEGAQGIGKGLLLETLGGEFYGSITHSANNKVEFSRSMKGKMLIEFPEGAAFEGVSNNTKKDLMTRSTDFYRGHYKESDHGNKRSCVLCITTNEHEMFTDSTGERRYWPVLCQGIIKHEELGQVRDQLFAEAYHRLKLGDDIHKVPYDLLKIEHKDREEFDPWEEFVMYYLESIDSGGMKKDITSIRDIFMNAFPGEHVAFRARGPESIRIRKILRKNGWTPRTIDNKRCWVSPDYGDELMPPPPPERSRNNYAPAGID